MASRTAWCHCICAVRAPVEDDVDGEQDGRVGIAEGITEEGELVWNHNGTFEIVTCADALWGFNSEVESL